MSKLIYDIRPARPSDAKALNRYMKKTFADGEHLITQKGEFTMGPIRQRMWIARKMVSRVETCLIAIKDKRIIGMIDCWTDKRARVRHATTFAISVAAPFQGKGIGRRLLSELLKWADDNDTIQKVNLHVFENNKGAIKLYESMGFSHEGRRTKAVKYSDGTYYDELLMGLWLDDIKTEMKD